MTQNKFTSECSRLTRTFKLMEEVMHVAMTVAKKLVGIIVLILVDIIVEMFTASASGLPLHLLCLMGGSV